MGGDNGITAKGWPGYGPVKHFSDPGVMEMLAADRQPWDRQPEETPQSYRAFSIFREMGPERSVDALAKVMSKSPSKLYVWSGKHLWVARAEGWDLYIEKKKREAEEAEIIAMGRRHAQQSQAYLQALMMPALAVLDKLKSDPDAAKKLQDMGMGQVLTLASRCAAAIPGLVKVERLARGEPESIVAHDDVGKGGGDLFKRIERYSGVFERVLAQHGAEAIAIEGNGSTDGHASGNGSGEPVDSA